MFKNFKTLYNETESRSRGDFYSFIFVMLMLTTLFVVSFYTQITALIKSDAEKFWLYAFVMFASLISLAIVSALFLHMRNNLKKLSASESEVKKSEKRLSLIVETAKVGLIDWDLVENKIYFSPILKKMLGYQESELESSYDKWIELIHPHSRTHVQNFISNLLKKDSGHDSFEHRILHKDGMYRWMLIHALVVKNGNNKPARLTIACIDVTEQRNAHNILVKTKEYAENIIDTIKESLIVIDGNYVVLSANRSFYSRFNLKKETVEKKSFTEILNGVFNVPNLITNLNRVIPSNHHIEDFRLEIEQSVFDKKILQLSARKIYSLSSHSDTILITIHDATENEYARRSLIEYAKEIEDLYDNAPAGYHSLDADGTFIRINNTELKLLGYKREEVLGIIKFQDLLTEESKKIFADSFPLFKSRGYANDVEFDIVKKNGTVLPVILNATAVKDNDGSLLMSRSTMFDNTERKNLFEQFEFMNDTLLKKSEQLEMINNELEAFTYSVSHDLRAPLRHIFGFVELMQKSSSGKLDEKSERYLNIIADSAKDMGKLIDDLLNLSRVSRTSLNKSTIDMNTIVEKVFSEIKSGSDSQKLQLDIHSLPIVTADPSLLNIVWMNLISNAVKYSSKKENPKIEIGYAEGGNEGQIFFIKDNGAGFDEKYKNKLFGVFQRLHSSVEFEGVGIGLATVKRIVSRHQGKVWAEGKPGEGAVFYFSLPN